jgi:hypothetical protein
MKAPLLLTPLLLAGCGPLYLRTGTIAFNSDTALTQKSGTWKSIEVPDAPSPPRVLAQEAASPAEQFNLALCEQHPPQNADVRVQVRAVEGQLDQGGGIVWRATDEKDYYLARWNPLEKNVCVYKVEAGTRTLLQSQPSQAAGGWHTLRVWFSRDKFEVWFDKQSLGEKHDASFLGAGMVGLWTKSDARTQFDDLEILEF